MLKPTAQKRYDIHQNQYSFAHGNAGLASFNYANKNAKVTISVVDGWVGSQLLTKHAARGFLACYALACWLPQLSDLSILVITKELHPMLAALRQHVDNMYRLATTGHCYCLPGALKSQSSMSTSSQQFNLC